MRTFERKKDITPIAEYTDEKNFGQWSKDLVLTAKIQHWERVLDLKVDTRQIKQHYDKLLYQPQNAFTFYVLRTKAKTSTAVSIMQQHWGDGRESWKEIYNAYYGLDLDFTKAMGMHASMLKMPLSTWRGKWTDFVTKVDENISQQALFGAKFSDSRSISLLGFLIEDEKEMKNCKEVIEASRQASGTTKPITYLEFKQAVYKRATAHDAAMIRRGQSSGPRSVSFGAIDSIHDGDNNDGASNNDVGDFSLSDTI